MKKRGEKEKEWEKRKRKGGESLWLFLLLFHQRLSNSE
jgi:ABC-type microcin C transport system permease subunit YejE